MKFITCILLLFIPFTTSRNGGSQSLSPELVEPAKKLHDAFDQNLKERGWTRRSVESILRSPDVMIDSWNFFDRYVKVSIVLFPSDPRAAQEYLQSIRPRGEKKIEGIENEAFVDGYCGKTVTLFRDRLSVSVHTEMDLKVLSMNEEEKSALACSEAAATSRLIACFVNLALNGDLDTSKRIPRQGFLQRPCEQELLFKRLLGEEIRDRLTHTP